MLLDSQPDTGAFGIRGLDAGHGHVSGTRRRNRSHAVAALRPTADRRRIFYDIGMSRSSTPAQPVPCDAPSAIPWLSQTPTNGSNTGGTATDVTVTFDSTG